jgi:hypothetical protein
MFDIYKKIKEGHPTGVDELDDFLIKIKNKEIPLKAPFPLKLNAKTNDRINNKLDKLDDLDNYDDSDLDLFFDFNSISYESAARAVATKLGMWAIVDLDWTSRLSEWIDGRKCLEVMSGVGWLSKALSVSNVDITATDDLSWMDDAHKRATLVHDILQHDALEAVEKFIDSEIFIISWPPYTCDKILEVCEKWGSERPIVYIGEYAGGCNAPDAFFKNFTEDNSISIDIPRYQGLHDRLRIGYWKK